MTARHPEFVVLDVHGAAVDAADGSVVAVEFISPARGRPIQSKCHQATRALPN